MSMFSSDFSLLQKVEKSVTLPPSPNSSEKSILVYLFAFSTKLQKTIVLKEKKLGVIHKGKHLFWVNIKS